VLLQQFRGDEPGKLALFEAADEVLGRIGKADEPVTGERRARGHAQRRQNARIGFDHLGRDGREVSCQLEALPDTLDGRFAGVAVRLRRELHEPLIELINRGPGISLPQVRLVAVDEHGLM